MMGRLTRSFVVACSGIAILLVMGCACTKPAATAARDGVFIHIKSGPDQAHSVLMGLRMAQLMSNDRDVMVYLDVEGIKVVLKDSMDQSMKPFGSGQAMIADLINHNVGVYACPGCLEASGKTASDLMPGVKVAEKEAFFAFTKGRILTLDY